MANIIMETAQVNCADGVPDMAEGTQSWLAVTGKDKKARKTVQDSSKHKWPGYPQTDLPDISA